MVVKTSLPLPKSMRAVEAVDGRGGVRLVTVPVPAPGRGKVLVRMVAAPINPSDLGVINTVSQGTRTYPLLAGGEGSGVVVAAGAGAGAGRLLGKRVAFASTGGAWSEYAEVKASNCVELPDALSFEAGATLLVNPLSALILMDIARQGRHRAIVSTAAAGQLGRMLLQLGKKSRRPIIHVVRRKEQVRLLQDLGAKHVLNSSEPDFEEKLREKAAELKATLILDAVSGSLTRQLAAAAPPGSLILSYGNLSRQPMTIDPSRLLVDEVRVAGFYLPVWLKHQGPLKKLGILRKAIRLVTKELETTIGRKFLLTEIDSALAYAQNQATEGRALLVIDPEQIDLRTD